MGTNLMWINEVERVGGDRGGSGCLQPLSPSLFVSRTTTTVNSSAHPTPTLPEMPTLQQTRGKIC